VAATVEHRGHGALAAPDRDVAFARALPQHSSINRQMENDHGYIRRRDASQSRSRID
jgi:hypothetical protein